MINLFPEDIFFKQEAKINNDLLRKANSEHRQIYSEIAR